MIKRVRDYLELLLTAQGDIPYASAANTPARLAKGTAGQQLRMNAGATAPEWYTVPAARVYHSAGQSVANATYTILAFDSERFDTDAIHDNVTNNSRLTCKTAGKYLISGNISWDATASGDRELVIVLNSSPNIAAVRVNASSYCKQVVTTIYDLAVNDYVELYVMQTSGSPLLVVAAPPYSPEFMMVRVG